MIEFFELSGMSKSWYFSKSVDHRETVDQSSDTRWKDVKSRLFTLFAWPEKVLNRFHSTRHSLSGSVLLETIHTRFTPRRFPHQKCPFSWAIDRRASNLPCISWEEMWLHPPQNPWNSWSLARWQRPSSILCWKKPAPGKEASWKLAARPWWTHMGRPYSVQNTFAVHAEGWIPQVPSGPGNDDLHTFPRQISPRNRGAPPCRVAGSDSDPGRVQWKRPWTRTDEVHATRPELQLPPGAEGLGDRKPSAKPGPTRPTRSTGPTTKVGSNAWRDAWDAWHGAHAGHAWADAACRACRACTAWGCIWSFRAPTSNANGSATGARWCVHARAQQMSWWQLLQGLWFCSFSSCILLESSSIPFSSIALAIWFLINRLASMASDARSRCFQESVT